MHIVGRNILVFLKIKHDYITRLDFVFWIFEWVIIKKTQSINKSIHRLLIWAILISKRSKVDNRYNYSIFRHNSPKVHKHAQTFLTLAVYVLHNLTIHFPSFFLAYRKLFIDVLVTAGTAFFYFICANWSKVIRFINFPRSPIHGRAVHEMSC